MRPLAGRRISYCTFRPLPLRQSCSAPSRRLGEVNRQVPRLVDALPNGPRNFATVQVFLAGGVPEVMLHLRRAGLLDTRIKTVTGETLVRLSIGGRKSERRQELRRCLREQDGIDPDDVIMTPDQARSRGIGSTVCFPVGNLAPEGSVIKSTAIDPSLIDTNDVYRHTGPARSLHHGSRGNRGHQEQAMSRRAT